ncbi:MAG: MaoC family dehydratase [Rhodospirillales bacterium]
MPAVTIESLQQLKTLIGTEVAVSDWLEITQQRVNDFADATGDHQWIHIDPERAARESPYKKTVAHGFLTLSPAVAIAQQTIKFSKVRMGINYGANRVRFTGPVAVGAKLRARFTLKAVEDIPGGAQTTWNVTMECEGEPKPA